MGEDNRIATVLMYVSSIYLRVGKLSYFHKRLYTRYLFFQIIESTHVDISVIRFRLSVRFVPSTNSTHIDMNRAPKSAQVRM